jgi:hypothetical protein
MYLGEVSGSEFIIFYFSFKASSCINKSDFFIQGGLLKRCLSNDEINYDFIRYCVNVDYLFIIYVV